MKHLSPRESRKRRTRKKVRGTAERPRLSVYRSLRHVVAQLIDDEKGVTLVATSTLTPDFKEKKNAGNVKGAKVLGLRVADLARKKGIEQVVFDRGGFQYHGRVKAVAEGAREGGLRF